MQLELVMHGLLVRIDPTTPDEEDFSAKLIKSLDADIGAGLDHVNAGGQVIPGAVEVGASGPDRVEVVQLLLGTLNAVLASPEEARDVILICCVMRERCSRTLLLK